MARRTRTRRANVDITELSFVPDLLRKLEGLMNLEVHIGASGDEEIAKLAGIHEYGSLKAKIPSRSFIGSGRKKSQRTISQLVKRGVNNIVQGSETARGLLTKIGETGKEKTIKNFDRIRTPPLSPRYAVRKTGNKRKILVQEQKLRNSITYKIVRKGR